jgi:uncharacterized repeat protein (TIGR03803 family)
VRQLETRLTPSLSTLASFGFGPAGASPEAGLVMDGSGNLYGTAYAGGPSNAGTVFEIAHGSGTLSVLASFNGTNGANPSGTMILDGSGNLYGTTVYGGASVFGTVFEVAHGSGTITTLASFNATDGAHPRGALIMDSGGNLYGTTNQGGGSGVGTVFEVAAGSGTITALASFDKTDGANPWAGLVMDGSGNLYGTTLGGGANGYGTVFELAAGSGTITTLASFDKTDGANPYGALVLDGSGNLYGTANQGGSRGDGTVFELAQGSGTITTLASFSGGNGRYPVAGLVMDASGNLYGTATQGGASNAGTVFEVAKATGTITALASFNGTDGANPQGGLLLDSSGNLYGTTAGGGTGYGTVFELAQGSGTITTLASFVVPNGANPYPRVIMDGSGNLYGTTQNGGTFGDGTVFELAAGSGTITTLGSFDGTNGSDPLGGLVMDGNGNLYGTTYAGGGHGVGTIFEVAQGKARITRLASFNGTDGANPVGGLIMDSRGNLYGTTYDGGALPGLGTVFELAHGSGSITTLVSLGFGTSDFYPLAGLVMDDSGNLYGTASGCGADVCGAGTVFEVAKGSGSDTTLASFVSVPYLGHPHGGLFMDASGNLFGTTYDGGPGNAGTVFELAAGSSKITTLASFSLSGTGGNSPSAGVVVDSFGNLYGTTSGGGASFGGTVFEVPAGSGAATTLVSFNGGNGWNPTADLFRDAQGDLFGTTNGGGAFGGGTVFELPGAAAPDQWTGANSAVDTNWSDGANWSLGTPPGPGQTVVFTNNSSVKSFTSTVDAGFTNTIGVLEIDSTWGGAITVNSPLTVAGNFTLASGSFGGSGAVTIAAHDNQWTGGEIVVGSGGFTNTGRLTVNTAAGNVVLTGAGTLSNDGTITEAGTNSLVLENSATLSNAAGATFDLTANGGVSQSGGGSFANAGLLEKTGGTGTSTISTTTLNNTGTVDVASGSLDIAATVTQVSGKTLMGGVWTVTGGPGVHAKLDITSVGHLTTLGAGSTVTLNGPNAGFTNLLGLGTIDTGATFSLLGAEAFTTTGALTNKGSLLLAPGSVLTVNGSYTQPLAGTLTIEMGGTDTSPTIGQLVSTTGTVSLAGSLDVTSTVLPAVGSAFELLDNEGNGIIGGAFKGLTEGLTFKVTVGTKTMKFKISYAGTDADGKKNVVITRVS